MPAQINIDTTITYGHIENAKSRVTQHIGGTRSGKTWSEPIEEVIDAELVQSEIEAPVTK